MADDPIETTEEESVEAESPDLEEGGDAAENEAAAAPEASGDDSSAAGDDSGAAGDDSGEAGDDWAAALSDQNDDGAAVNFDELAAGALNEDGSQNLDFLLDIPLEVSVELGRTSLIWPWTHT